MINPDHSQTDVNACIHVKVRIRDRIHILIEIFATGSLVCSRDLLSESAYRECSDQPA